MVRAWRGGGVANDSTPISAEADVLLSEALYANATQIRANHAELHPRAWVGGFQGS